MSYTFLDSFFVFPCLLERKAAELAAKKAAEEAERKRIEDLRIAAENQVKRADEITRLYTEHMELMDLEVTLNSNIEAESKFENERIEWAKFREPTEEINANSERELNTFITLSKELVFEDMKNAMEDVGKVGLASRFFFFNERMFPFS